MYVSTYNSEKRRHWASKSSLHFNVFIKKEDNKIYFYFSNQMK